MLYTYAVVTIGFENTAYTTDEGETLVICVIVLGPLEREAIIRVTSKEGSAEGTEYDIRKKNYLLLSLLAQLRQTTLQWTLSWCLESQGAYCA